MKFFGPRHRCRSVVLALLEVGAASRRRRRPPHAAHRFRRPDRSRCPARRCRPGRRRGRRSACSASRPRLAVTWPLKVLYASVIQDFSSASCSSSHVLGRAEQIGVLAPLDRHEVDADLVEHPAGGDLAGDDADRAGDRLGVREDPLARHRSRSTRPRRPRCPSRRPAASSRPRSSLPAGSPPRRSPSRRASPPAARPL